MNAEDDDGDRVVVRLVSERAGMPPHHEVLLDGGASTRRNRPRGWRLAEHWALAKSGDRWVVPAVQRETIPGRGPEHPSVAWAEGVATMPDARVR